MATWRSDGYTKWKEEQEDKKKRGATASKSPRNPIQYKNSSYQGESATRKTSYDWEKALLKDLPVKRYGRSYNDKFDKWASENGISSSDAKEFRRWMDSQEDGVSTTNAQTDSILSNLTSKDRLERFKKDSKERDAARKERVKAEQKKKSEGSLANDFLSPLRRVGQALNPFDDVSFTEAFEKNVQDALSTDRSKVTKEATRGLTRIANTGTLGALDQIYKKTNGERANQFTNENRGTVGKVADFGYDALGYLIPGMGAYGALNASKAGKTLTQFGSQGLKQRIGSEAAKGALTGGALAGAEVGIREGLNPDDYNALQNLTHLGIGVGAGAVADPAIYGIARMIKGALPRRVSNAVDNATTQPTRQAEEVLTRNENSVASPSEPLGLPEPQLRLPAPRVNQSIDTMMNAFQQPGGLSNPIPEMPDIMRFAAARNRMQQSGVDFGYNTKNTPKARPNYAPVTNSVDPMNRNQSYWQGRYEDFAKHVNDNYDMNQMTPEALEDIWTQFARYDEPVRLEQAIDLAYPRGFEAPPVQKPEPTPPRTIKDDLRDDPRINELVQGLYPPKRSEPPISRRATLEEMFQRMDELAPPRQPEPPSEPLRFSRPQESLVGQQGLRPKGFEKLSRRNKRIEQIRPQQEVAATIQEPSVRSVNPSQPLKSGRDFEPIESISSVGNGGRLIQVPEVDRTPIEINNPKEIVKRQIDIDGKREKSKWSFDKFMTAAIDDLRPLDKATRQLGGNDLSFENNPYTQARLARGVAGKAETYLRGGIYNEQGQKIGQSLEEIIKPIENKMDDFLAYATSKRALDYDEKSLVAGIKPKDVEGMSDRQLADATIRQLEAESPEFKAVHQELVSYNNRLMDELVDAGVLDEATVLRLREENPNYIPMFRVQEPKVRGFQPLSNPKNKYANLGEPIKKRTGSEKPIINPVESIIKNTYLTLNMAERNRVGRSLFDLIEGAGENTWGRVVKQGKGLSVDDVGRSLDEANTQLNDGTSEAIDNLFKGEGNKVYVYKDGAKIEMELQEDLYKAMLSLDTQKQNFFIKMLSVPTRMLRTGAVLSPDFGPVNIFRDQFSAYVNSKYGFKPFVDMFSGLANVLKKDDVYWSWKNNGGANSVLSTLDREYLQQDLRRMVKQSLWSNVKDKTKHPLRTLLEPLRKVSEITEEATRVGEFKKGLKKGATPREAAFASRDLIDFNRAGNLGRQYNQVTAFFNAAVQSMDKTVRTFKENPAGATVRALTGITLPSIVAYMYNHDKEWYREIPQRERDLYWHFEIDDQIYKLPKPFEVGVMFGTVAERTLDALKNQDPEAFEGLGETIRTTFTPPWLPTAITPWIEAYANRSTYFDSPIVPRREQDLLPEDQYGPYQSEIFKAFGALTKTSPRKAEHIFKGYTGGLGKYALMGTDGIAKVAGQEMPELPDRGMADMPIINRFVVKNLEGNNQSVNDFYERMDALRRENLSAKKNDPSHENTSDFKKINKISREISDLQTEKRDIIADMNMDGKEKARRIKYIDKDITELAKKGKLLGGD